MAHELDLRTLARSLVEAQGDGALEYARHFAEASPGEESEAGKMWHRVAIAIELLIEKKEWRRRTDGTPH